MSNMITTRWTYITPKLEKRRYDDTETSPACSKVLVYLVRSSNNPGDTLGTGPQNKFISFYTSK